MNKYTLGTIIGTATLGMIKSKIGSGMRLRLKEENLIFYSANIRIYDYGQSLDEWVETAQGISNFITTDPNYDWIVYIDSYEDPYEVADGEWANQYILNATITITKKSDEEYDEDHLESKLNWGMNTLEDRLAQQIPADEIISEIESWHQRKTVLYNADTGEKYKPTLKKSKLRKR